ncbi:hypothetical protein BJI69_06105 [Luteibacter rhizovicinus DSM 16549]|uniref:Uncharacterized protein n=1 Tax=Luteibacter rhizovicinus DSM 16549 TaxID=1440763 RepID=A0A0G9H5N7_9GAMM|nr:hypothetical protein [Luteibacter rhizovicinus]APG03527.1 hypothetical protein BJI69_06105 [Luteibacter rhizovicinus DSM 16549]KLD64771.1 hypothetical protein Y883_17320 [Luteibacter rhizovicinus DSM 16549]KLD79042.1 hypothetical protein Y886_06700 [Xanthomonas hyacinthi DSM 19077]
MPYSATVFSVLIASPSDVPAEREAIARTLHDWNALNSQETGHVLLPVMWESHVAPTMGDRPQALINGVARTCDMLIGAFWTRLGSPTGVEESGTVEEIRWFLKQSKPVMLYYSQQRVDLDAIDTGQLEKLKDFKKSIRDKGIQDQYVSPDDLRQRLLRHLTIVMRDMSVSPVVDARVVKAAKASTEQDEPASETGKPAKAPSKVSAKADQTVWFEDYTDRSFVVRGDTLPLADKLRSLGGKWIPLKSGGKAWNFSKKRLAEVAKAIKIKPILREPEG